MYVYINISEPTSVCYINNAGTQLGHSQNFVHTTSFDLNFCFYILTLGWKSGQFYSRSS